MPELDYSRFEALTFDCYGTLIDWESGILARLRAILSARDMAPDDDALLEAYAGEEAGIESGPYLRYRSVLARACMATCRAFGVEATREEAAGFGASVPDWPAFADSAGALVALAGRFGLGVITNCDDDLFAGSNLRLGEPFRWVVTAQQVGAYKPSHRGFELAFGRLAIPRERILHVAQSLFHDHVPAAELGVTSIWIDRRRGRAGTGATPAARAAPAASFPDMASFASAALA
jgi:2-haloacid dehalogenase